MTNAAYTSLETHFAQQSALSGAVSILHWDAAVMMPESAAEVRGGQLAALQQAIHENITDPRVGEWLDKAEGKAANLDDWQRANLHEMRRQWVHSTALDVRLVREQAIATSACEAFWRGARRDNDFKGFVPYLKRVLSLVREEAQAKSAALNLQPYDALMDGYDSGTRMAEVDALFARLDAELPVLREKVMTLQDAELKSNPVKGHYPTEKQKQISDRLMRALGFHGRLDVSVHPFCGGVPGDVRITTRYDETDVVEALQGVLHETGHALYEQNLPIRWRNQPVGRARGMSTHESQSLFVEMQLCRSREFLRFAAPVLADILGATPDADLSAENLYRHGIRVNPGFIRVSADEVCYPSHVILRYELEKALIAGELQVEDLPEAWNAKMQAKLGITPPDDRRGVLQDIHWSGGSFGYFPTYTLGAMMAAQWGNTLRKDIPDWGAQAERGEFSAIIDWLKRNVHEKASSRTRQELLKEATGEPLNADIYLKHLHDRYLSL